MKKNILVIMCLCFPIAFVWGQGKITGNIQDLSTQMPLSFAVVSVMQTTDSVIVAGGLSSEKGTFEVADIPWGSYFLNVTFIGYETLYTPVFTLSPTQPTLDFPSLRIAPEALKTETVEIVGEKALFQQNVDKKVFNVEKNLTTSGGTATDILQQIPMVNIDLEGNINLRGNENVTIMVDGKPTALNAQNKAQLLQQIQAANIESVEIITNPSAKYDAEGLSGIINIVTKKNRTKNWSSTFTAGMGTINKPQAGVTLNYQNAKWSWAANYNYRLDPRWGNGRMERENRTLDSTFYIYQDILSNRINTTHTARIAGERTFKKSQSLGVSMGYNYNNSLTPNAITYYFLNSTKTLDSTSHRDTDGSEGGYGWDGMANYRKTFARPRQEWTADASLSYNLRGYDNLYTNYVTEIGDAYTSYQRQLQAGKVYVGVVQSDYVHPFKNKDWGRLEVGIKATARDIYNDFIAKSRTTADWSTQFQNTFHYKDQVYASYFTYSNTYKKLQMQAGLRTELTAVQGNQVTLDTTFSYRYLSFFPNLQMAYELPRNQSLQGSISRRLKRPDVQQLNPIQDVADPLNQRLGNPNLRPEFTYAYELSYLKRFHKHSLSLSGYYRQTTGAIYMFRTVDEKGFAITRADNFAEAQSIGGDVIFKTQPLENWDMMFSVGTYQTHITGSNQYFPNFNNRGLSFLSKFSSNISFHKNTALQITFNYDGPRYAPQGNFVGNALLGMGLRQNLFKGKGTLNFNINDILNQQRWQMTLSGPNFEQYFMRKRESRIATILFTYRFGNTNDTPKKRKSDRPEGGNEGDGGFGG